MGGGRGRRQIVSIRMEKGEEGGGEIWMAANVGIEREEGRRDSFGGGNAYGLCGLGRRDWRGQSESGGASPPLRQRRGSKEIE